MTDHTAAQRGNLTPALLAEAARQVSERHPDARLIKNQVGNLSILVDGEYLGYIDLFDGGGGLVRLTEFLKARLDEDEQAARKAAEICGCHPIAPAWSFHDERTDGRILIADNPHPETRHKLGRRWNGTYQELFAAEHIARWDPARVLAEVEAKRRIIREYEAAAAYYDQHPDAPAGEAHGLYTTLKALALPYADHPDYHKDWRP